MARFSSRGANAGESRVGSSANRSDARDLAEPRELSVEEVLKSYEQPINEEQAWAVCYQSCRGLRLPWPAVIELSCILLHRDGTVTLRYEPQHNDGTDGPSHSSMAEHQVVQSLGVAIYRALDWGLDDSEEHELSPQLERLIERMVGGEAGSGADSGVGSGTSDEGYSGPEEDEKDGVVHPICTFSQVMELCASRLANPTLAPDHYQAVCKALLLETLELQTFLMKIRDAKEMLKKISVEGSLGDRSTAELDAFEHRDWARLWVQLMKELRLGVKLKKVEDQPFYLLPTEFSLTPFEMLMQDIRTRKFQLRKVMKPSTSRQTPSFANTATQTETVKMCSVGTQRSIKTLQPHVKSIGLQATTASGEPMFRLYYPKFRKGEGRAKLIKNEATMNYMDDLLELIFDQVFPNPAPFLEDVAKIHIPAPLSTQHPRPDKATVVSAYTSRFNPGPV